jgi:hypothetical protein
MAEAARHIPISKDSDLGRQLAEAQAAGVPIVLEVNGHAYRFTPQRPLTPDDPWKTYDPDKVRAAIRRTAGALKGVDREQLLQDLRDQRGQDDHGRLP